uniref:Ribosomal protein eL8/eL30/eS12/Gadd45 domain-containing protein n=1 Tax=Clastoptera arizonana TaxID=38151 RepID=A0A1B6DB33_9HEMI
MSKKSVVKKQRNFKIKEETFTEKSDKFDSTHETSVFNSENTFSSIKETEKFSSKVKIHNIKAKYNKESSLEMHSKKDVNLNDEKECDGTMMENLSFTSTSSISELKFINNQSIKKPSSNEYKPTNQSITYVKNELLLDQNSDYFLTEFPTLLEHSSKYKEGKTFKTQKDSYSKSVLRNENVIKFYKDDENINSLLENRISKGNKDVFKTKNDVDNKKMDSEQKNLSIPQLSDFPSLGSRSKKKVTKPFIERIPQKSVKKGNKPKILDPIMINIIDILKNKKNVQRPAIPVSKKKLKNVLSGNILDSDNPQRKRGKVRLGKKPKVSRLKAHILKMRQEKLDKENPISVSFSETLNFIEDITCFQPSLNSTNSQLPASLKQPIAGVEKKSIVPKFTSSKISENEVCCQKFHSRRFREYCDNIITPALVESVCGMLSSIVKFQDRQYNHDPIKAHAKRRYVTGLREAEKFLKLGKAKILILAPDLEKVPGENGLDGIIYRLKEEAQSKSVPYVFGPNRMKLGYCTLKKQKISAVAILRFEGAETQFSEMISLLNEARAKYKELVNPSQDNNKILPNSQVKKEVEDELTLSLLRKLKEDDDDDDEVKIKSKS